MNRETDMKSQEVSPLGRQTYYEVLNVSRSASRTEIRESYVRLRNTYNTQNQAIYSLLSDEDAQIIAAQVEEAFKVLNDDTYRRQYDASIGISTNVDAELAPSNQTSYVRDFAKHEANDVSPFLPGAFAGQAPKVSFSATNQESSSKVVNHEHQKVPSQLHVNARFAKAEKAGGTDIAAAMAEFLATADLSDGATFQKLRLMCGVSENEMQERTKVCIEYIRGIETNVFDRLPRLVFVKGFLRSYCKYLGVPDSERLVKAFAERLDHWQNPQSKRD